MDSQLAKQRQSEIQLTSQLKRGASLSSAERQELERQLEESQSEISRLEETMQEFRNRFKELNDIRGANRRPVKDVVLFDAFKHIREWRQAGLTIPKSITKFETAFEGLHRLYM